MNFFALLTAFNVIFYLREQFDFVLLTCFYNSHSQFFYNVILLKRLFLKKVQILQTLAFLRNEDISTSVALS